MGDPDTAAAAKVRGKLQAVSLDRGGRRELLEQITILAAQVVDPDASAGITVIRGNNKMTVAASDERTLRLDEIQSGNGDGPCLTAARTGRVIAVTDIAAESRWPDAMDAFRREGLRSSLSLPLNLRDAAVGALNIYMFDEHRVDDLTRAALDEFTAEASYAISIGLRHDDSSSEIDQLHAAMKTRRIIDTALGIIIAQNQCTGQQAFVLLRTASNNRNVKIRDLAVDIIAGALGAVVDEDPHFQGRAPANDDRNRLAGEASYVSISPLGPADERLREEALLEEIDMTTNLMIAASESDGFLTQAQIDAALGM